MSDPKPGDRVTPENVADLPIGTVITWNEPMLGAITSVKIGANQWRDEDDGMMHDDDEMSDPTAPVCTVGRRPNAAEVSADEDASAIATAIAHLTHAARTDGAHHKQHDVCAALKVLLSAEDYAALGIVDEGVPS